MAVARQAKLAVWVIGAAANTRRGGELAETSREFSESSTAMACWVG